VVLVLAALLAACGGGSGGASDYGAEALRSGEPVSVEELRGSPALLVSWATWCRECDEELAGLAEFAASDAAEGLSVVVVNLDAASVEDEIDEKIARHGLEDPELGLALWRDRRNQYKRSFGALGVPTTVLLDADGAVAGTFPGAIDFDDTEVLAALDDVRA
jgi:thiol-disulfide isomerase/thioredoxin